MDISLTVAATLAVIIGLVHSVLGERYIIRRLMRRDNLPKLFGSDRPTKMILRFAWHLTTIAWFGFAWILLVLADDPADPTRAVGVAIAGIFLVSAVIAGFASKGKHPAWVIFLAIAVIAWVAT